MKKFYLMAAFAFAALTMNAEIKEIVAREQVLRDEIDKIIAEIREKVPVLKENGGFIFSSDHSIPNSVSLENMRLCFNVFPFLAKTDFTFF